jgi:hypothetical protein
MIAFTKIMLLLAPFAFASAQEFQQHRLEEKFGPEQETSASLEEPAPSDTIILRPRLKLLPDNISFMEKELWGEDGILRTTGIASPLTPEARKSELDLRRTMLSLHQICGIVTMGFMGTAVYFGQRTIDGNRSARGDHQLFVTATIISYSATAALAIFSPPPLIRRDETSTTTIHKTLAWFHAAGMIITPILGGMIHRHSPIQQERIHQISGYLTTATFAAALLTVTF